MTARNQKVLVLAACAVLLALAWGLWQRPSMAFWRTLDDLRQDCLVNMCFNMGIGKLAKFDTFLGFVRQYDWTSAVADLAHTAWASELPRRFAHDSSILTTGEPLNV